MIAVSKHVGRRERTEVGPVDEARAERSDHDRELAAGDDHGAGAHPPLRPDAGAARRVPAGHHLGDGREDREAERREGRVDEIAGIDLEREEEEERRREQVAQR